jgi:hypothetical protein
VAVGVTEVSSFPDTITSTMMAAAQAAAEEAMRVAAGEASYQQDDENDGQIGTRVTSSQHLMNLDEHQRLFINHLEQSSSNGEIAGQDEHLLREVICLSQSHQSIDGHSRNQLSTKQDVVAFAHAQAQAQMAANEAQVEPTDPIAAAQANQFLQQMLMQQQQQQLQSQFHNESALADSFISKPDEHYLTIAQNGTF